jgi:hypothetical protein
MGHTALSPDQRKFELDVIPTKVQAEVLAKIHDGDRIVVARGGRGFVGERGDQSVNADLVRQLLIRDWMNAPGYPLFDPPERGRLTERGQHVLRRYRA